MFRLSDDDSRAVDILLDTRKAAKASGHGAPLPHAGVLANPDRFPQRLAHVEQLLGLLEELPTSEPPKALVARTLQAVETNTMASLADSVAGISVVPDLRPPAP